MTQKIFKTVVAMFAERDPDDHEVYYIIEVRSQDGSLEVAHFWGKDGQRKAQRYARRLRAALAGR